MKSSINTRNSINVMNQLFTIIGNNKKQIDLWLKSYNTHLKCVPQTLLETEEGQDKLLNYLAIFMDK